MVYGRLNWPTGLTEQAKAQYEQYLKEHIEQIASDFIRQKRGEELEWLLHYVSPGTGAERTVYRSGKSGRHSEISGDFKYAYGVPEDCIFHRKGEVLNYEWFRREKIEFIT